MQKFVARKWILTTRTAIPRLEADVFYRVYEGNAIGIHERRLIRRDSLEGFARACAAKDYGESNTRLFLMQCLTELGSIGAHEGDSSALTQPHTPPYRRQIDA
jgi:hypothetical protein